MAVRWPDGSYTGSVRVETPAPAPVEPEADVESEPVVVKQSDKRKEVVEDGDR